ncbi:MAG: NAD(P)/FAD-dependent oxidoreductase [Pseudomonadota bacterium]|nr:NAD(P)/FAD-dependent oxidoreductase [Pseudomonadota bacterium]
MVDHNQTILIAGAGPVGMTTGLALASAGIPVKVFDALGEIPRDHRASTLHPSTLMMVEDLGMTDILIERGIESPMFQFRDRVSGDIVAEFDYRLISDSLKFPYALQVEQHKTIEVARDIALDIHEFELHRERELVDFSQDDRGVEITVESPDGAREVHTGAFLIGADGGRSVVRKILNIDFPGFTWEERFIIVSTYYDFEKADGWRYRNYVAHPEQWCAMIKVPGEQSEGVWRALFPAFGNDPDEHVLSDEWIQARFAECYPYDPPYDLLHRNLYSVHQRVADSFSKGRVALAGDAAHVNNPLGGMGMNSGIHDGLNLAEKLVAASNGADYQPLLARYDRQRRPMAEKYVQAQSIQNKRLLQESDPEIRKKRLKELSDTAANEETHRAYLLRASLVQMVNEANAIE